MIEKIIIGGRKTGRTTQLIKMSERDNIPILCCSSARADYLKYQANKSGYKIPSPVTLNVVDHLRGTKKSISDILIDDADELLQQIVYGYGFKIKAITMMKEEAHKMENNYRDTEKLAALEFDSKVLRSLVDTILEATKLDDYEHRYNRSEKLTISDTGKDAILVFIKAFYGDEYKNRLEQVIGERKKEEDLDNE